MPNSPSPFWLEHPLPHGLSDQTRPADFWPTPRASTEALLASYPPPRGMPVLDPCAGDGAILRVLADHGYATRAVELREEEFSRLLDVAEDTVIADWLAVAWQYCGTQAIATNPPFSLAVEIISACLGTRAEYIAALLPADIIARDKRRQSWRRIFEERGPTAIRGLRNRPSFSGDGKTAFSEYAWFIWDRNCNPLDIRII